MFNMNFPMLLSKPADNTRHCAKRETYFQHSYKYKSLFIKILFLWKHTNENVS